ncbi:hypothetical protein [Neolewinella persica]|uniref:hypothetical protein n=1 Tax=Neolewinella persica TaxID=70998 RepID=UPI00037EF2DC|nr:hypothetical protein [Neolewinella persica]
MNLFDQLRDVLKLHGITPTEIRDSRKDYSPAEKQDLVSVGLNEIWTSEETDEDHLAKVLYGASADRKNNSYKKIKQRLIDRLGGEVINIDLGSPAFTSLQRGYYSAHREYIVATILDGRGVKQASAFFYRRALRKSINYGATTIEVLCLQMLREYAARIDRNQRIFEEYNERLNKATLKLTAENEVTGYYSSLILAYDASPQVGAVIHKQALNYLKELDQKYDLRALGYRYGFPYYLLKLLSRYSASQYELTIAVADEAIAHFSSLDFFAPVPIVSFLLHKLTFYTILKQYTLGVATYEQCIPLVQEASAQWFKLKELAFLLMMHNIQYDQAFLTYKSAAENKRFEQLGSRNLDKWRVYRAYLYYLKSAGFVSFPEMDDPLKKFRLGKFFNSLPLLDKEKEGNNISILILRILFLVQRKEFPEAADRIEALEKYLIRYLGKNENYRSKCFIKILQQFAKAGFRRQEGLRRTRSWHGKLLANPISDSNQSYEIEVVPYENLYAVMLGLKADN